MKLKRGFSMKNIKSAFIFIATITLLTFGFIQYKWHTFKAIEKLAVEVKTTDDRLENIAGLWFDQYTKQFKDWLTPFSYKIKETRIDNIELLDQKNGYVQIDYAYLPFSCNEQLILNHGGLMQSDDGWYKQQVVLRFEKTANGYQAVEEMRPVNYQIMTDPNIMTEGKKPTQYAIDQDYDYTILDHKLWVTYDHGENFVEVPIEYEKVTYNPNYSYAETVPEGSYIIEKDYTAFLYVDDGSLGLIYSYDQGKNWETTFITANEHYYLRARFLLRTENQFYVLFSTDKAMSAESHSLMKSTDGIHFEFVDYQDPEQRVMTYAYFSEDSIGYVAYRNNGSGDHLSFYRTEDGGQTFAPLTFELKEISFMGDTITPYIQVDRIYQEDGQIHLIVGQGENGDYGFNSAHYTSIDEIHFTFVEEVDDRPTLAG